MAATLDGTHLTDDQIYAECEKVWRVVNTWGFSYNEFITLAFKKVDDGMGTMQNDNPSDTVYTAENGSELTRAMVHSWCQDWRSFSHGFLRAYRHIEALA